MIQPNSPKGFKDTIFWGIVSLQILMFLIVLSSSSTLSFSALRDIVTGSSIAINSKCPEIVAYNVGGFRQNPLNSGRVSAIILASACSCERAEVQQAAAAAMRQGESVCIVFPASLEKLRHLHYDVPLGVHLLSMRDEDFMTLGVRDNMPLTIHVDPNGWVKSIHYASG